MTRKFVLLFASVVLVAMPFVASADTVSDIRAKIQEHVKAIQELQIQLKQAGGSDEGLGTAPAKEMMGNPGTPRVCQVLARNLAKNASGEDVAALQEFLKTKGHFEGEVSTFFGAKTEAAVQAWQSSEGLISSGTPATNGFGAVGPKSREALMRRCQSLKQDRPLEPGMNASSSVTKPGLPPFRPKPVSSTTRPTPENAPKICPMIFAPVCGIKNDQSVTYSNRCFLEAEQATFVSVGSCVATSTSSSSAAQ